MGEDRGEIARDDVFRAVYSMLRTEAKAAMRGQRASHTLQPTALANEAFLKLAQQASTQWTSRAHFLGVAARAMRSILVDHARTKSRAKRKATGTRVKLDATLAEFETRSFDLVVLDEALEKLAKTHERAARIVELRFFGGLRFEEIAEILGVPLRSIEREWQLARAWLHAELR